MLKLATLGADTSRMGNYWSTGIIIDREDDGRWRLRSEFHDDKFAVSGRISGTVELHYGAADLERGIDDLVAAVAKLGIRWGVQGTEFAGPYVYVAYEELNGNEGHFQREAANEQAERLGWPASYRPTPA